MRIVHITRDFPPRVVGGISTAVGGLVQAMAPFAEQRVLSFDGYRPTSRRPCPPLAALEETPNAAILRVQHPGHLDDALAWARDFAADIAHCHHDLLWDATLDVETPATAFTPHVLHFDQDRLRGAEDTASARAQARALATCHRVFAPSASAAEALRTITPRPIDVAPLGIWVRDPPSRPPVRDALVCVGRFSDVRGTSDVFAAARELEKRGSPARLVCVGGLPDNPRSERRWRARAPSSVHFTGWLDAESVWAWMWRARVAVLPSWVETFGYACAEAMASGAPIVASDIPALRELLGGGAGVLVPPRNPRAIADAIIELEADRERCARFGAAARARAESDLGWPTRVTHHLRIYRELAKT